MNPKSVYKLMKGDNKPVKKIPLKEDVESYWTELWSKEVIHNDKAPWLDTLGQEYCTNVQQTQYTINEETFDKVVNKMQNGKSPGNDLIVGYWHRHLTFYRHALIHLFEQMFNEQQQLPAWLTKARTQLIPKLKGTNIACQKLPTNSMSESNVQVVHRMY